MTNIVAAGSGVIVKDSGSAVGTAGTVDFKDGLDVSAVSAGIVTVTINEAPRATLAGIASEAIVAGIATFATLAGLASQANNALFANSSSFSTLTGAADTAKNLYTQHEGPFHLCLQPLVLRQLITILLVLDLIVLSMFRVMNLRT